MRWRVCLGTPPSSGSVHTVPDTCLSSLFPTFTVTQLSSGGQLGSWISTKVSVEKGQQTRQESTSNKTPETSLFTAQQNQHLLHGSCKARGGGLPEYQLVTGAQWHQEKQGERKQEMCYALQLSAWIRIGREKARDALCPPAVCLDQDRKREGGGR